MSTPSLSESSSVESAQRLSHRKVQTLIAMSYGLDTALITGFAVSGAVYPIVPVTYAAAGWLSTGVFFVVNRYWFPSDSFDPYRSVAQVCVAALIQLALAALAPQLTFLPLMTLFIVFGFGSLRLPPRAATFAWLLVSASIILILMSWARAASWIPHQTDFERALVGICFCATLGRCILLGTLGRNLRAALERQRSELVLALDALRQRDTELAAHRRSLERANAELHHKAMHDALTGLPNRTLFTDRVQQAIARAAREPVAIALLVIDLDRFKVVNDTLGHSAGDQLLRVVAGRLKAALRDADTVARVGGDEFLIALPDITSRDAIASVATKLLEAVRRTCRINDTNLNPTMSVGVSVFPSDGNSLEQLLAHADEAMYAAKQKGRDTFTFYDREVATFGRHRLQIEDDLHRALSNGELELHYQPKVDLRTQRITSVEALLRWRQPMRGLILPGEFIAIAEETGLIIPIGDWVLGEACRQARAWQLSGTTFLRVAVNLSPVQFRRSGLLATIRDALAANELDPRYLELEVTESTVMGHAESSVEVLAELSRMGVVVSLDDFGTGYSSMSYLRRFPIDKLKIDRSFIQHLHTNPDDELIVRAMISLAHSLRLKVVAEGVETEGQLECLRRLGCDQYQGFFMSPAIPAAQVSAFLAASGNNAAESAESQLNRTYSRLAVLRPTKRSGS